MRAATVAGRTTVLTDTGALDVEKTRASRLIFSGRCLVSYLSAITACCPGDLIFDGTPAGVGMARTRPRHLRPGN
jgi:acylpyruvate hydrolase